MKLRPHHILDIVASFGAGIPFVPADIGHGVHTVAAVILNDPDHPITMTVGADEICRPCSLLGPDRRCTDHLTQISPPRSKQEYNDELDMRVLAFLGVGEGAEMTAGQYYELVDSKMPGIAGLCAHPGEDRDMKRQNLKKGLDILLRGTP